MAKSHDEQNGTNKPRLCWRITRLIGLGIGGVLLAALFAFLLGVIVQWLWNWLMPAVFGLKQITFLKGIDISADMIAVAEGNARAYGLSGR